MTARRGNPIKILIHEIHPRSLWQVHGIYLLGSWIVLQIVSGLETIVPPRE